MAPLSEIKITRKQTTLPPSCALPATRLSLYEAPSARKDATDMNSGRLPPPLQYDNLIIDQSAAKELQCGICLQLINKPRQCKNGHLFCLVCITKCISKNPECPTCRCKLDEETLARSLFVERHIRNLKVYCQYHFKFSEELKDWDEDEQGCPAILTLETRAAHEAKCGYALVSCKFSSSCGKQRRMNQEAHESSCPYRPLDCKHCKKDIQFCHMEVSLRSNPTIY